MRILHVVPSYLPAYRYGGPILSVHNLNKWLVKKNVEVTVYTTNINGSHNLDVPLGQEVIRDGVKINYFPITFRPWRYSRELQNKLSQTIKSFDLIHITSVFLSVSTLGAHYAKKFKKPYIISPRGSLMEAPLKKKSPLKKKLYLSLIEKRNLRDASAIHFTAEMEQDEYVKSELPLKKSIIIPNGLDPEDLKESVSKGTFRKKWRIPQEKKIILFLGRLSWKKGLDTLIPAMSFVAKKEPRAFLVLEGAEEEGYKQVIEALIKDYGLEDKVLFTGSFPGKDVAALQDSDVFVLPSYSENFGIAVLQAMYFGLPVVVTDAVAIAPEVLRAEAGLVIRKNEEELAEAILKLLAEPSLAKEMGRRGKKLVLEKFSWPEITKEFVEAYNKLIKAN